MNFNFLFSVAFPLLFIFVLINDSYISDLICVLYKKGILDDDDILFITSTRLEYKIRKKRKTKKNDN